MNGILNDSISLRLTLIKAGYIDPDGFITSSFDGGDMNIDP